MEAANFSQIEHCSLTFIVRSPSTSYIVSSLVACVVNAIFAVAGTFLNSFVLFTFWKSTKLKKKITYFLIMVLSSTDLGVGLLVHPLYLLKSVSEVRGTPNCLYKIAYQTSMFVFSGLSATALLTLNIERYLSIVHPLFHRNRVTKSKCFAFFTIVGLFPPMTAITRILGLDIWVFTGVMTVIICLGTGFMYVSIFHTARKASTSTAQAKATGREQQRTSIEDRKNTATFQRDLKLAKTCFLVVSCCFVCYFPTGVLLGIWTNEPLTIDSMVQTTLWTTTFTTINSTLNCLIFFWARPEFRKECRKALNLQ